jgi:hypothetical protein
MELARLAGEDERAKRIDDVWNRAYGRKPRELNFADIRELLSLIDGLELRLVGTVVDKDWRITADQLPEIRKRTKLLDLDARRGRAALAIEEGLHVGVS